MNYTRTYTQSPILSVQGVYRGLRNESAVRLI